MTSLIPFNRRNTFGRAGAGFEEFHNMIDDFFADGFMHPARSLARDSFKIDIEEKEEEYLIEAEIPGIGKDEIDLSVEGEDLCICVNRSEETEGGGKNYIHRERRTSSMSRRVRLAGAKLDAIKAKLEEGILTVTIPKDMRQGGTQRIDIA